MFVPLCACGISMSFTTTLMTLESGPSPAALPCASDCRRCAQTRSAADTTPSHTPAAQNRYTAPGCPTAAKDCVPFSPKLRTRICAGTNSSPAESRVTLTRRIGIEHPALHARRPRVIASREDAAAIQISHTARLIRRISALIQRRIFSLRAARQRLQPLCRCRPETSTDNAARSAPPAARSSANSAGS